MGSDLVCRYDLQPGEKRVVDNGMLVAWNGSMDYNIAKVRPDTIGLTLRSNLLMFTRLGAETLYDIFLYQKTGGTCNRFCQNNGPSMVTLVFPWVLALAFCM